MIDQFAALTGNDLLCTRSPPRGAEHFQSALLDGRLDDSARDLWRSRGRAAPRPAAARAADRLDRLVDVATAVRTGEALDEVTAALGRGLGTPGRVSQERPSRRRRPARRGRRRRWRAPVCRPRIAGLLLSGGRRRRRCSRPSRAPSPSLALPLLGGRRPAAGQWRATSTRSAEAEAAAGFRAVAASPGLRELVLIASSRFFVDARSTCSSSWRRSASSTSARRAPAS